ncbi:IS200/IS605 family transposase [Lentisphaera marina]|uniref:IS200/IS605 family transposase n=1 Tax=Lentisphaera marina TaxID=1111041 RepID=UPI003B674F1B
MYIHTIFHISFSDPVKIPNSLQDDLHKYIAGHCKSENCIPILINGTEDHIHLLTSLSKSISASSFLNKIKSTSSKWIKSKSHEHGLILKKFSWQKGYGVFSVSPSILDKVKAYVENQEEHHKRMTFKEEYMMFLEQYKIDLDDEKYLWID